MAAHRVALTAALAICTAATASAQLRRGFYLATHPSRSAGAVDMLQLAPNGAFRAIRSQLSALTVEAATRTRDPGELLLAVADASGSHRLMTGALRGDVLTTAQAFGLGRLRTPIRRVRSLPTGNALVATDTGLYEFAPNAGVRTVLAPATGRRILDLDFRDGSLVALLTQQNGTLTTALAVSRPYSAGTVRVVRLPIAQPIAAAVRPGGSLAYVSTARGAIQQVDLARFAITTWPTLTIGTILAFGFDTDQDRIGLSTHARLHHASSGQVDRGVPVPTGHRAIETLEYLAYDSAVRAYGTGCPGTNGRRPILAADGRPFPGNQAFAITLTGVPVSRLCVLNLGTRQTRLDLTGLGMPGCFAWSDSVLRLPNTTVAPRTVQPLPIPANPSNVGVRLYSYWAIVDPSANRLGLTTSNGGLIGI